MGIMPVLVVIIVIASVVSNYKKIARQRLADQKKRIQMMKNASKPEETHKSAEFQTRRTQTDAAFTEPLTQTAMLSNNQKAKPGVSVKEMQKAVIMSEILNKPVSLREK